MKKIPLICSAIVLVVGAAGCVSDGGYGSTSHRVRPRGYYGGFNSSPFYGRGYYGGGFGRSTYGNFGGHFGNRSIYRGQFGH